MINLPTGGWAAPAIVGPPLPRCKILPNPHTENPCGSVAGDHTILDYPICDECYSFVKETT